MQALQYKDYFSLKTLHKFGVKPETNLDLNLSRDEILLPFGKLNQEDKNYLNNKVDMAYLDNGLSLDGKDKETLTLNELEDNIYDNTFELEQEDVSLSVSKEVTK